MKPWYAIDLDGTLAYYDDWKGPNHIGSPIQPMVDKVKQMLAEGKDVRIFTARVFPLGTFAASSGDYERVKVAVEAKHAIEHWCLIHIGKVLPITCIKDYGMVSLYDDRAIQVEQNTGVILGRE